jgi:hypothetical protein
MLHFECSAANGEMIDEMFARAAKAVVTARVANKLLVGTGATATALLDEKSDNGRQQLLQDQANDKCWC